MRLTAAGGGNELPVAGTKPAKSCTEVFFIERIVYSPATSKRQMAVCSVPADTVPLFVCRCRAISLVRGTLFLTFTVIVAQEACKLALTERLR
jgi:hypothetical protein